MVDLVTLQATAYVAQIVGVIGTLTAAFIAVRSYIGSNKRAEESRARELETRQAQLFMGIFQTTTSIEWIAVAEEMIHLWKWNDFDDSTENMVKSQTMRQRVR